MPDRGERGGRTLGGGGTPHRAHHRLLLPRQICCVRARSQLAGLFGVGGGGYKLFLVGGVNHCSLHCRLAKIRGLMRRVKYGAVIGQKTRFFVCAQYELPGYGFLFSQSQRRNPKPEIRNPKPEILPREFKSLKPLNLLQAACGRCDTTSWGRLACAAGYANVFSQPQTPYPTIEFAKP